jgi:hypothetical protein
MLAYYDVSDSNERDLVEKLIDGEHVRVLVDTENLIPESAQETCPAVLVRENGDWKCYIRERNYFEVYGGFRFN